jgi:dTDP-4-amino-4,6-dideoxy-D-galactose acyltransferase
MVHQNAYEFRNLEWDTNYFGVKSSRVTLKDKINKNQWVKIRNLIVENDFIVIDNINNDSSNNFFISNLLGVFLTDINFQFIKDIASNLDVKYIVDDNIIVKNNMEYNKQIVDISESSYKYSRFFNDPFLDKAKAKNIYSHWVESSFSNENKYFLYYYDGSNILGYILFSLDCENNKAVIELISVKENMNNKGIGTKMMFHLESYLLNNVKGIRTLQVGTQSNNTKGINFYIKNGFKVRELRSVYHYWPNFMLNNMDVAINEKVAVTNK